jgi:4-amino-4-deoxy-L-arabinose transferase-like glycosyltransferase
LADPTDDALDDFHSPRRRPGPLVAIACVLFALAVLPTLSWLEFASGSENLVAATLVEMRQDGHTLVPELMGEPRLAKPPWTTWIASLGVSDATIAKLDDDSPDLRAAAYVDLAEGVRWTALAGTVLMLLGVYELGRVLAGWRVGLIGLVCCATTLMTLRYGRSASTDVQLAAWVSITLAAMAHAIVDGRRPAAWVAAGVALGLAFFAKGPVAFAQTLLPALAYAVAARQFERRRPAGGVYVADPGHAKRLLTGGLVALAIALAVGLPWFAYVFWTTPDVLHLWAVEVTREGATDLPPSNPLQYLALVPLVLPWSVFFVVGLAALWIDRHRVAARRVAFAAWAVLVPILIMSLSRDRKERYLLPLIGPASVVIAYGVVGHLRSWRTWTRADTLITALHWLTLATVAVGFTLVATFSTRVVRTVDETPWFEPSTGMKLSVGFAALIAAGVAWHRRWPGGILVTTAAVMLSVNAVFVAGYARSAEGRSDMRPLADAIRAVAPAGPVFYADPAPLRPPEDLAIYLARKMRRWDGNLPTTDRPVVLITRQAPDTPVPHPAGDGWRYVGHATRGESRWWAWARGDGLRFRDRSPTTRPWPTSAPTTQTTQPSTAPSTRPLAR